MKTETIEYNGWQNCLKLSNGAMELVVTTAVGPRVIRCGFSGKPNLFAEIAGQQGGTNEPEWMIRGGHRLWLAPETSGQSYELDNTPVEWESLPDGISLHRVPGPRTHVSKHLTVVLAPDRNIVTVTHILKNEGNADIRLAPWALTVMAPEALLVVPLPEKTPPGQGGFVPNQTWSIWPYTDLSDGRWRISARHLFFQQRSDRDAGKLGLAQREGWTACQLPAGVFVKKFKRIDGAVYPDGNVNFETFANRDFLEVETLGPLTTLAPGTSACHVETWELLPPMPPLTDDEAVARHLLPALNL